VPFIAFVIAAVAFDFADILVFFSVGALILFVLAILLGQQFD
jgi:hypothetical protein